MKDISHRKIKNSRILPGLLAAFGLLIGALPSLTHAQDINLTGYSLTFDDEFSSLSITGSNPKGSDNWYAGALNSAGNFSSSTWSINAFSLLGSGTLSDEAYWVTSSGTNGKWYSGLLCSVDPGARGFSQQYGYFEIKCQMPNAGEGAWPAFWLDTTSGITSGSNEEVDIFEWYGVCNTPGDLQDYVSQASHNWNSNGTQNTTDPYLYAPQTAMPDGEYPWQGYHIYGCQVDPVHITWYIDGVQTNQINTPAAYLISPFYVLVDYALGGGWPLSGTPFTTDGSSSLDVEWVRVWALPASGTGSSIGAQFVGGGTALSGTQSAGVPAVAQTNWKPLTGSTFGNVTLNDNTGTATTAVLTGSADGTYFCSSGFPTGSGNRALGSGELYDGSFSSETKSLTVSSIPYSAYDVYLYTECDAAGRGATFALTPSGGSPSYYSLQTESSGTSWTITTNTWNGSGTPPSLPVANCVHYAGLTGTSFSLKFGSDGSNISLNGIQIVQTAPSQPIGVQFVGGGTAMTGTQSAGVTAVAQTNWQPLTGSTFSNVTLKNSGGASTTAVLTGSSDGSYFCGSGFPTGSGDRALASGELYDGSFSSETKTLNVSSIPYATYDVYLYAECDAVGRGATFALTPSGGSTSYYSLQTESSGASWTITTNTWNGSGTAPSLPVANCVHYVGLTGSSFSLKFGSDGSNISLDGIQIVPVP